MAAVIATVPHEQNLYSLLFLANFIDNSLLLNIQNSITCRILSIHKSKFKNSNLKLRFIVENLLLSVKLFDFNKTNLITFLKKKLALKVQTKEIWIQETYIRFMADFLSAPTTSEKARHYTPFTHKLLKIFNALD